MGEFFRVTAEDGVELSAYVARPAGEAKGAVIVVQEIFGINAHIRSIADKYAAEGYTAIAPALFDRIEPGIELSYSPEDMGKAFGLYPKLEPAKSLLDIAAAYKVIAKEGPKGIAVIGFCYGGLMTWLSSTRSASVGMKLACGVAYYGGGIGKFATEEPSCPMMLHFGANDSHIGVDQIDAVRASHPEVEIYVYEGAGHAFNRDPDPNAYNPAAAKLAGERTLEFLRKHIG